MVVVEEVRDESQRPKGGLYQESEDGDNWESDSEFSSDSDDSDDDDVSERGVSIRRESAWDRVKALQDIVPPSTRRWFGQKFNTTTSYAFFGGKLVGNLVWIATTSALLVGLPYALASEEEAMLVKQEREFAQQQSGAQQMLGGPPQQGGQEQQQGGLRPPGF